jgi:hypothetical protein
MMKEAAAAAILLGMTIAPATAQQLTVQANERKYNGQVWDGVELYSPAAMPTNTPPDLAVCVVPLKGPETCLERMDGRQLKSLCQNSHSCTFTLNANGREPFGLYIYDIDLKFHDLVDTVIVVPDARTPAAAYAAIDIRLRELMETKSPAFTPMEKDRRKRETFVVTRDQCASECPLAQSRIVLR